jgi:large subunit ribosomal protein L24
MRIKKGDIVTILSGDDKGKTAKVLKAFPAENKILVEGVNMMKKHERSKTKEGKGQTVERAMPIDASKAVKADKAAK